MRLWWKPRKRWDHLQPVVEAMAEQMLADAEEMGVLLVWEEVAL